MMRPALLALASVAGSVGSTAIAAEPAQAGSSAFGAPVSEAELGGVRGSASPFSAFTRRSFADTAQSEARATFRFGSDIPQVQMDVWWGTIGSELIATAVRADR